jgi:hypothetical protein
MLPVLNKAESVKLKAEKKKKKKHFPMLFVNVNFKYERALVFTSEQIEV